MKKKYLNLNCYLDENDMNIVESLSQRFNCSRNKVVRLSIVLLNLYLNGISFKYIDFDKVLEDR